jgi:hypothetical protein
MSSFIANTQTNYTLYYNVLNYFKTIMTNHPSINYVSQGDVFSMDDLEFPGYPLGNVLITEARFVGSETLYSVQLTVADKTKPKNNESVGAYNDQVVPFEGTDDTVDVHANTLAIINDLTSFTAFALTNFQITSDVTNIAFKEEFNNGLAGWVSSFTLLTHNERPRCEFNLYPNGNDNC